MASPNEQPKEVRFTLYLLYSVELLHGKFHRHATPTAAAAATAVAATFAGSSGGFGVADGVGVEVQQKHALLLVLTAPFVDAVHLHRARHCHYVPWHAGVDCNKWHVIISNLKGSVWTDIHHMMSPSPPSLLLCFARVCS